MDVLKTLYNTAADLQVPLKLMGGEVPLPLISHMNHDRCYKYSKLFSVSF
jgi:hypothetical protein